MAEAAQRAVDMALLAAVVAIGADQGGTAVEALSLARLARRFAGLRFDRARDHAAGDRLAQGLDRPPFCSLRSPGRNPFSPPPPAAVSSAKNIPAATNAKLISITVRQIALHRDSA